MLVAALELHVPRTGSVPGESRCAPLLPVTEASDDLLALSKELVRVGRVRLAHIWVRLDPQRLEHAIEDAEVGACAKEDDEKRKKVHERVAENRNDVHVSHQVVEGKARAHVL
eukprot:CAMPEP_0202053674 /NCGR_PEP_ID=MMETSP0963-20130614/5996_1 /ASSEMBLY_ACC=CAM_ASM_000494 /TAXON_ID=4773 /ORGANISM="Schizochytrium aggregatum, Strain ATCC28209" /LENGTH=112 /DNA_ID=CAMNT_0048619027 /DNA_START=540 /DNA_END=878 /DNA_ORIENTATION=-